jgi:hypothetical protein
MCYEVTHEKDMQNLKINRDCGRARNAQGSPKAGARAIFVQNNVAQPHMLVGMLDVNLMSGNSKVPSQTQENPTNHLIVEPVCPCIFTYCHGQRIGYFVNWGINI